MLKATLKGLLAHKVRLGLTALSIVLGVAFIAGTYIYTDTIGRAFDGIFADAFEGVDILVSGESDFQLGDGVFLPEDEINALADVEGVESVETVLQGFGVIILDKDGEPIGGQGPPQFGASLTAESSEGGFELREGSLPVGANQVVLDAQSASTAGYAVGDTVSILTPTSSAADYEMVGVAGFGELDNLGGATFALFDLPTIQTLLDREGQLSGASIQVVPGADVDEVIARIEPLLPENGVAQSGQSAAEEQAGAIQEGLGFFNTFLLIFGYIAVFVGTFIIYNTFRIIVSQRTKELALLRALGASRSQVNRMVLIEALMVGLFASIVGIIVGFGVAVALRTGLEQLGVDLPATSFVLQPRTIVVSLLIGVVVTVIAAVLPARRASKVPPIAALRDNMGQAPRRALTSRAISGTVVTAVGLAALAYGLLADIDSGPPAIAYVGLGVAIVFIGVAILSPLVARPVANAIGMPFERLYKVPGKLARENAGRSPRRTSSTASALMIGITLVALVAVMGASIRGTVDDVIDNGIDADLYVLSTNQFNPLATFPALVADEAEATDEIAAVTRIKVGPVLIGDAENFASSAEDNFADFFPPEDGTVGDLTLEPGEAFAEREFAAQQGWELGEDFSLTFEDTGEQTFTLVGIPVGEAYAGFVALNTEDYIANFGTDSDSQVYMQVANGVDVDDAKAVVEEIAAGVPTINVQTQEEFRTDAVNQINGILNLITGLLGLAVLIALIGVTNTMTLAVYERTREIGLLRAVGLSRRQTRRMIRSEASIIAVFGAILGVAIGTFFAWAILRALADQGFTAFVIPWGQIAMWIVITGVLGIIFALLPARRAARLNVLDAIAYE